MLLIHAYKLTQALANLFELIVIRECYIMFENHSTNIIILNKIF